MIYQLAFWFTRPFFDVKINSANAPSPRCLALSQIIHRRHFDSAQWLSNPSQPQTPPCLRRSKDWLWTQGMWQRDCDSSVLAGQWLIRVYLAVAAQPPSPKMLLHQRSRSRQPASKCGSVIVYFIIYITYRVSLTSIPTVTIIIFGDFLPCSGSPWLSW